MRNWLAAGHIEQMTAGRNGEHEYAEHDQGCVDPLLKGRLQPAYQQMGINISREQDHLEKEHACDPDRSDPAEPRQKNFSDDRLNLEQQEGA